MSNFLRRLVTLLLVAARSGGAAVKGSELDGRAVDGTLFKGNRQRLKAT
jgi:hypothetical protein